MTAPAPGPTDADREKATEVVECSRYRGEKFLELHIAAALAAEREAAHEWQCPSCGATTRARMADHRSAAAPSPATTTSEGNER